MLCSHFQNKKRKIIPYLQPWNVLLETQERVRDSRGKRAIGVRATEVLLYNHYNDTRGSNEEMSF